MTEDFNIKDDSWNPNFLYYFIHRDTLMDIADSLHLELSWPTNQVSTRYSYNQQDSNLVIDQIFLRPESSEYDNYSIYLDWRLISDLTPLTVNIAIFEKHVQTKKYTIVKNSEEEEKFINKLIKAIKELNMENIQRKDILKQIMQTFTNSTERIWYKHNCQCH